MEAASSATKVSTLAGAWSPGGSARAKCHLGSSYCIGPYSYGWAVQGFLDHRDGVAPLSLKVAPWQREPDYRQHEKPILLTGTLTAEQLAVGTQYSIYRWDSVDAAFTYEPAYKIKTFTAAGGTFVYEDPKTFLNNGTVYYRCVEDGAPSAPQVEAA